MPLSRERRQSTSAYIHELIFAVQHECRTLVNENRPQLGLKAGVQECQKSCSNVRPKRGPKTGLKPPPKSKKPFETSKSRGEKSPKKGQKWTSKTALKNGPKNRRKNLPKIPQKRPTIAQNRPQMDHKVKKLNKHMKLQDEVKGERGARFARMWEI